MDGIGRKFYHALGGIWLIAMYYALGRDRALLFYAGLALVVASIEAARLGSRRINEFIFKHFSGFIRKKEADRPTGTLWYVLGVGLSFFLFSPESATASVCFLAFGDVTATTIGQRYGKTKLGDKSLEGTAGFLIACAVASVLLSVLDLAPGWQALVVGSMVAAAVELMPIKVNDNLSIPVIAGGVMEAVLRWP